MASDRQIKANRENARRSTGPATPEGKAKASLNALRHGLFARGVVLPHEDRDEFLEILAALEAAEQPQGPIEAFLIRQLASAQWRLQRFTRIETGFFTARSEKVKKYEYGLENIERSPADFQTPEQRYDEETRILGITFGSNCGDGDAVVKLARYQTVLSREYYRALKAFNDHRKRRPEPQPSPPAGPAESPRKTNPISPQPIVEHQLPPAAGPEVSLLPDRAPEQAALPASVPTPAPRPAVPPRPAGPL
jgi:hypothetical protein